MSTSAPSPLGGVNVMAVVSLFAAVLFAPVGIVFGAIALRQITQTGERGRELALAGIWIGIGILILALLIIGAAVLIFGWSIALLTDVAQVL